MRRLMLGWLLSLGLLSACGEGRRESRLTLIVDAEWVSRPATPNDLGWNIVASARDAKLDPLHRRLRVGQCNEDEAEFIPVAN